MMNEIGFCQKTKDNHIHSLQLIGQKRRGAGLNKPSANLDSLMDFLLNSPAKISLKECVDLATNTLKANETSISTCIHH